MNVMSADLSGTVKMMKNVALNVVHLRILK